MKHKIPYPNINHCWGALMVEELIRSGVEYFCLAPGSRCAPLSVAVARNAKARAFVHFDERGLAFHALGYVAAAKKPAVLICTSGTAVANFLPAIVEASKKKLPLIVLTADRPPELRHTGSVQTIDQVGIFGKYAVWQIDMPCPEAAIAPEMVLTTMDQAVYQAIRHGGVVHVNCMFREPLAPTEIKFSWGKYLDGIKHWSASARPYTAYFKSAASHLPEARGIAGRINAIKNGIIVVGKTEGSAERQAVIGFARRLGWPIFADIASGLRLGSSAPEVIHYFDQILLSNSAQIKADGILHLGGRITSKRYYQWIAEQSPSEYIMVLNHPLRNDPLHKVSVRVEAAVQSFCESIGPLIKPRIKGKQLAALIKANQKLDKALDVFFAGQDNLSEPHTARLVSQLIPQGTGLFLSNSMPIRDMDMYADCKGTAVPVAGNRGASGIDGLIASACGYAQGLQQPVTLMIGDLAALHDLNSLAMLKDINYPVVVVILNNGGGAIFSFLPIAAHQDVFEKFFGTPHPFTFANAAGMFDLNYARPTDTQSFSKAYTQAFHSKTSTIIEVITSRKENVQTHNILNCVPL